jgi:hypothetical protein
MWIGLSDGGYDLAPFGQVFRNHRFVHAAIISLRKRLIFSEARFQKVSQSVRNPLRSYSLWSWLRRFHTISDSANFLGPVGQNSGLSVWAAIDRDSNCSAPLLYLRNTKPPFKKDPRV